MNDFVVMLISSLLGLLTGGIPAYLTFRSTKNRLDAESAGRDAQSTVDFTDAMQRIVDSTKDQIDNINKVHIEELRNMESKCFNSLSEIELKVETMDKDLKFLKTELLSAKEEITNLTRLVCELYTGAMELIKQLKEEGLEPNFELPDIDKDIEELIEKNGWH